MSGVERPDVRPEDRSPDRTERDMTELVPSAWHDGQVWVSCYRAFCIPQQELLDTQPFDLFGVRCQLLWGGAPYWRSTLWMEPQFDGGVVVHADVEGLLHADDGPFIMLTTPTEQGTTPLAEEETRARLRSALALLRLALGRNIAVEPLGELIFTPGTKVVTAMEAGFRMPTWDGPPDTSMSGAQFISQLHDAIEALDEHLHNRVELSLQWFFRAQQTHGVSGFLMYWFTLEALAMNGPKDLKLLKDRLGAIYDVDRRVIVERFRMGRLYGLRGAIVHNGLHPMLHHKALDFLAAVYWDLLLDILGLDSRHAAGAILEAQDIDEWFPEEARHRSGPKRRRSG